MSDYLDDYEKIPDTLSLAATVTGASEGASVRPGVHVKPPHATDEDWHAWSMQSYDIGCTLQRAEHLWRVARRPYIDAAWPALRYQLLTDYQTLGGRTDTLAESQRCQIRRYLGHPRPGPGAA